MKNPTVELSGATGWTFIGIGIMCLLILCGIGGCIRLVEGKGPIIVIQAKEAM